MPDPDDHPHVGASLATTARIVAALNLGYFSVEIVVALAIGSVSLFADSIDFLEDASISLLLLVGLGWRPQAEARLGMGLAGVILVPGVATLVVAWRRYADGTPPEPAALTATGLGALLVNGTCAWLLANHRKKGGSLVKAAFLSARNDVIANVAIVAAGLVTAATRSPWPDIGVGLAIVALNAGAASEVWAAARAEQRAGNPR